MNLAGWFLARVWVATFSGVDRYGTPAYTNKRQIAARVEAQTGVIKLTNAREVAATHVIFTPEALGMEDRVWLPGSDQTVDAQAKSVVRVKSHAEKSGRVVYYRVSV